MEEKREGFGSRIGFILVSAGCAIGIGNVWKFPYICGQNGGAIFVLLYLFFLLVIGVPVLTMELAMGRASRKTIVEGYKVLEKKNHKWHLHGWLCNAGCYLLMMYYTTVAGWMLAYFWKYLTGEFKNVPVDQIPEVFSTLQQTPIDMTVYVAIIILGGFAVLVTGVKNGLEKVSKFMMTGLLALILVLVINSLLLKNSMEGVKFYLLPDFGQMKQAGILNVITAAMNQAFFTLSVGMGSMEIFGSYMSKNHTLIGESLRISALDTFVALMSGLIIFPACFSFNISPDEGPSLIFITLPSVFADMRGGRIWGTLFFLFMTFASFSTVTAVFENIVGSFMDNFGMERRKAILINVVLMIVLSMPCVLGFSILSNVHLIGGRDILETEDFLVSNIFLPFGSLIFVIFCMFKLGWGADKFLAEVNTGKGIKLSKIFIPFFQFVLPVLILVIFVSGLL